MAIALTAAADMTSIPPRVILTVTGAGSDPSATIVCNESAGQRPVRGAEPLVLAGGAGVAFDFEAPRDVSLTWTATSASGSATSNAVTVASNGQVLLLHPGAPALSVYLKGDPIAEFSSDMQSAVYSPLGRAEGVYFSTGADSAKGTLTGWTESFAETQALVNLLRSGFPVRLLAPAAHLDTSPYLGIMDVKEARITRIAWDQSRAITASFQVVTRPISALQLVWTYTELNAEYATYADLNAAYAGKTYIDLAIGPAA